MRFCIFPFINVFAYSVFSLTAVSNFTLTSILNYPHTNSHETTCLFNQNISSNEQKVYFTFHGRKDGMGSSTIHLLYAAAYCNFRKWRFLGLNQLHNSHGVNNARFYDFLFGNHTRLIKGFNVKNYNLDLNAMINLDLDIEKFSWNNKKNKFHFSPKDNDTYYYIEPAGYWGSHFYLDLIHPNGYDLLLNDEFLAHLRQQALCGLSQVLNRNLYFNQRMYNASKVQSQLSLTRKQVNVHVPYKTLFIVSHIRRGDTENIGPPLSFHLFIYTLLYQLYPSIEIHVFTQNMPSHELEVFNKFTTSLLRNDKQQDKHSTTTSVDDHNILYIHNDVATHNDLGHNETITDVMMSTFAHLVTADVLIKSHSGLSQLAAYYNPNCIIHTRYRRSTSMRHQKSTLKRWIFLEGNETENYDSTGSARIEHLPAYNITFELLTYRLPLCLQNHHHLKLSNNK